MREVTKEEVGRLAACAAAAKKDRAIRHVDAREERIKKLETALESAIIALDRIRESTKVRSTMAKYDVYLLCYTGELEQVLREKDVP